MILNSMGRAFSEPCRRQAFRTLRDIILFKNNKILVRAVSSSMHLCFKPVQRTKQNKSDQSIFCARYVSLGHAMDIQLKDSVSHEEWNENYWSTIPAEWAKVTRKGVKFECINALSSIRTFTYVLIKDGSKVTFTEDIEKNSEILKSSHVLAASHVLKPNNPLWVIKNKYNTIEEWEAGLKQHTSSIMSRNLLLTATMDFLLGQIPNRIKMDKDIDLQKFLSTPLVDSFLDYIFSADNVEFCQRALCIYLKHCAKLNRYDLINKHYGRAKKLVKLFNQDFMIESQKFLLKSEHVDDIFEFVDILRKWTSFGQKPIAEILCIRANLASGDLETALALLGNFFNDIVYKPNATELDALIIDMLDIFSYSEDPKIWSRNKEIIEVLLTRLANTRIFPKLAAAKRICRWFKDIKDEKWDYALVYSSDIRTRVCPYTKVILNEKRLTDEEYDYLKRVILKEIIQDQSNINQLEDTYKGLSGQILYSGTSPEEVRSFLSMIYEHGPFDLVVDGLNLVYKLRHHSEDKDLNEENLLAEAWLRQFVNRQESIRNRKLRVLVVTRSHLMNKNSSLFSDFATVWRSFDDSEDDPYFVYAALLSGRGCDLLTLDLLKDLTHKLGFKTNYLTSQLIFKWQQIHQILMVGNKTRFMKKQKFDVSIQRTAKTWHIPYLHDGRIGPVPEKWICLKRFD